MRHRPTQKYCAEQQAIAALKRDGIGWGHDLECGFIGHLIKLMKGL